MEVAEAKTAEEIVACFAAVKELRPHIQTEEELVRKVQLQNTAGYRLMYIKDAETGKVASISGFRIVHHLWSGKTLYIDDLCSLPFARGRGHGRALLEWVIQHAKDEKCEQVDLDSGYTRNNAHRLYLNCGFNLEAHHFSIKL